jgi:hypothetical protein
MTAPALTGSAVRDDARLWRAAWHGLVPAYFIVAAVLGVAWGGANALGFWMGHGSDDAPQLLQHFIGESVLPLFLLVPGLAIADAVSAGRPFRATPYAIAAIGASVLGETLFRTLGPSLGMEPCACSMDTWPLGSRIANMLPDSLIICGFITAGYCYRQRASQRLARVRAAELERARVTREMQESRLQAMQACIEPQFLFDTLGDVDRLQRDDNRRAVQLLDDLIAYLRAALPHLAATNSTVGKECGLATAYLNIQRQRHDRQVAFEIAIVGDAQDARMPPMLLLPLIDYAVRAAQRDGGGGTLRVRVMVASERLHVTVTGARDWFGARAGDDAVAAVRERLRSVYGDGARLDVGATDTDSWLALEMPYEPALAMPDARRTAADIGTKA